MGKRSSDVVGDALLQRYNVIRKANNEAGIELGRITKNLKEPIDVTDATGQFLNDMSELGINMKAGKLDFKGSDIDGFADLENIFKKVTNRLKNAKSIGAYDAHRVKKYIDKMVTYGKNQSGLDAEAEGILKKLRTNINDTLGEKFPEYKEANVRYSETIKEIDSLQDVAGRKMDLSSDSSSSAVGTLLRRLTSNALSRVRLEDAIDGIEGVAKKYGGEFDTDIRRLVISSNELDRVFKTQADTSLAGEVGSVIESAGASLATGGKSTVVKGVSKLADKVKGVNQENAFKAIKELLKE
jgi:hypothetical protein